MIAAFFHDVIYCARSGTSKEDSAAYYRKFEIELQRETYSRPSGGSDGISINVTIPIPTTTRLSDVSDTVVQFILATKSHTATDDNATMGTRTNINLLYFLDADMVVVLSKQPDAYDYYAALIREEYKYIPHDTYCEKRAKIMGCFLGSGEIECSTARASPVATIFIPGAVQEFF